MVVRREDADPRHLARTLKARQTLLQVSVLRPLHVGRANEGAELDGIHHLRGDIGDLPELLLGVLVHLAKLVPLVEPPRRGHGHRHGQPESEPQLGPQRQPDTPAPPPPAVLQPPSTGRGRRPPPPRL